MQRAIRLARKAEGDTSPNPMVGAVVVKEGRIIGEGFHRRFGGPHAEVDALDRAGTDAKGAELYVNLEPCSHFGKTPPCVDRVIQSGVSRVVISNRDPNPLVNGAGLRKLSEAGIETILDVLPDDGEKLNEAYFKFIRTGKPFVVLKWAQTIDGRIATGTGDSRWISSQASRKFTHQLRRAADAVLVGSGTVQNDNPQLTVRHVKGRQPWRIVLDHRLDIRLDSTILNDDFRSKTVVFTANQDSSTIEPLQAKGVEVEFAAGGNEGRIDLDAVSKWMVKNQLISLLVEGGRRVITSYLRSGVVDKIMVFVAPKLMGKGIDAVGDLGIEAMQYVRMMKNVSYRKVGPDILVEAYLR